MNYPESESTWEPLENLQCMQMLADYESALYIEEKGHSPGSHVIKEGDQPLAIHTNTPSTKRSTPKQPSPKQPTPKTTPKPTPKPTRQPTPTQPQDLTQDSTEMADPACVRERRRRARKEQQRPRDEEIIAIPRPFVPSFKNSLKKSENGKIYNGAGPPNGMRDKKSFLSRLSFDTDTNSDSEESTTEDCPDPHLVNVSQDKTRETNNNLADRPKNLSLDHLREKAREWNAKNKQKMISSTVISATPDPQPWLLESIRSVPENDALDYRKSQSCLKRKHSSLYPLETTSKSTTDLCKTIREELEKKRKTECLPPPIQVSPKSRPRLSPERVREREKPSVLNRSRAKTIDENSVLRQAYKNGQTLSKIPKPPSIPTTEPKLANGLSTPKNGIRRATITISPSNCTQVYQSPKTRQHAQNCSDPKNGITSSPHTPRTRRLILPEDRAPHSPFGLMRNVPLKQVINAMKIDNLTYLFVTWKGVSVPDVVRLNDIIDLYPNLIIEYFQSLEGRQC